MDEKMKFSLSTCFIYIALAVFAAGCNQDLEEPYIGEAAPTFELVSLEGETVSLDNLKGSPVVIHFGTSWCPFCRAEDPNLEALHKKHKDNGVKVLVINVKEDEKEAMSWFNEAGFSFPMLLDKDGSIAASYAPVDAQPDLPRPDVMIASNLIVDREGVIRFFSLLDTNAFDAQLIALTERLDEILAEQS